MRPLQGPLMTLSPKPGILDISPYVGGRSSAPGAAKVFKLSSNESPLGPSPRALAALQAAGGNLALYPDGSSLALRQAIAAANGIDAERIVVGGEGRSEEHTSELQSHSFISYAVFCLQKK